MDGSLYGYVIRTPKRDGKKLTPSVLWLTGVTMPDGSVREGWTYSSFPSPRPPYGLDGLAAHAAANDTKRVVVMEGEKKVDLSRKILADLGYATVGWCGGANAVGKTDWTHLKGYAVFLWPDNDGPGFGVMVELAFKLQELGCDVYILKPPKGKRKGWDAGDAVQPEPDADGSVEDAWSLDQFADFLSMATPARAFIEIYEKSLAPTDDAGESTVIQEPAIEPVKEEVLVVEAPAQEREVLTVQIVLERTAEDIGYPYGDDILDWIIDLQETNGGDAQRLMTGIKRIGVSQRQLIKAVDKRVEKRTKERKSNISESEKKASGDLAIINEIYGKTYPLPSYVNLYPLIFKPLGDGGRIWVHEVKGEKHDPFYRPLTTPVAVTHRLKFVDDDGRTGLRIAYEDMDEDAPRRFFDIYRSTLADTKQVKTELLDRGIGISSSNMGTDFLINMLSMAQPADVIRTYSKTGWHMDIATGEPLFICPSGEVITGSENAGRTYDLSVRALMHDTTAGTLEGWKQAIHKIALLEGVPHWLLGIAGVGAGCLVNLTGLSTGSSIATCGLAVSGESSRGKTILMQISASGHTSIVIGEGLVQTLKGTENSMELLASRGNGTVITFDELGLAKGDVIGRLIYMLAGGQGKVRMRANLNMADPIKWRSFGFLTGEMSIAEKMADDDEILHPGMLVRFANISVTDTNGKVDPAVVKEIEDGLERNRGNAGPAFVRGLIEAGLHKNPDEVKRLITTAAGELSGGTSGIATRSAIPFAVLSVSADFMFKFGIIDQVIRNKIKQAILWGWSQHSKSSSMNPTSEAIDNLQTWLAGNWNSAVVAVGNGAKQTREGYALYNRETVYIPKQFLREMSGGRCSENDLSTELLKRKIIDASQVEKGRKQCRYIAGRGKVAPHYPISRKALGLDKMMNFGLLDDGEDEAPAQRAFKLVATATEQLDAALPSRIKDGRVSVTLRGYWSVKDSLIKGMLEEADVSAEMRFLESLAKTCSVTAPSKVLEGHVRWSEEPEEDDTIPFP
ncbi:hypothetical protein N825_00915 [Skermanella stibiiresistens SB22]|uniref:DUF927 domain-containing protein n=1 Tax=Skermanella stibiiresistens SB22 TaxID=1385369 RepID=W9H970_9PROT|nr:hypothetical protein N825_00915 [Skermanella stibiiresistens SB22]